MIHNTPLSCMTVCKNLWFHHHHHHSSLLRWLHYGTSIMSCIMYELWTTRTTDDNKRQFRVRKWFAKGGVQNVLEMLCFICSVHIGRFLAVLRRTLTTSFLPPGVSMIYGCVEESGCGRAMDILKQPNRLPHEG